MSVSLIVVSRHRPRALARAIMAIRQQDHPCFELIVVADPATCAQIDDPSIQVIPFDEPNISTARNLGLTHAAGEVVAFLDDDAVPEPTWLSRLVAPFADPAVVKAGGFTRGRNGLSFQWRACEVDLAGADHPLSVDPEAVTLVESSSDHAPKVQGTNCAFRRDGILAIGGFDPTYRFYLEDADVCLRLPGLTAIVPLAQVHHGFVESVRRRADRVPLSLHDIGASSIVFLRRHAPETLWEKAIIRLRTEQRARLLRHMVAGRIEPRDVRRLMQSLEQGMAEGKARPLTRLSALYPAQSSLSELHGTGPRVGHLIAGSPLNRRALEAKAQSAAVEQIVTVFLFGYTAFFHRVSYDPRGFWCQTGGVFGRAARDEPLFQWLSRAERYASEWRRATVQRPIGTEAACFDVSPQ